MAWIIPENKLDIKQRDVISCNHKHNLCITGFARTGKRIALCCLMRKIMLSEPNARCTILVYNNLNVNIYRSAFHELGLYLEVTTYYKFKKSNHNYDYIFCINIQNISSETLIDIKNRSKYVIVTMDPYITLYEVDPLTNQKTLAISDVDKILTPQIFELYHSPHCDSTMQRIVSNIIKPSSPPFHLICDSFKTVRTQIRLCKGINEEEEFLYIIREAKRSLECGYSNAILLPTNNMILSFIQKILSLEGKCPWSVQTNTWGKINFLSLNQHLEKNMIPFQCLGNTFGQIGDCQNKTSILTYHSSQGLHFDEVFIPNMNTNLFINPNEHIGRNALALAITRFDCSLYITYNGILHRYLSGIETNCINIDIHEVLTTPPTENVFAGI